MLTSRPITTISYNSFEFLILTLEELLKEKKIVFYMFIKHYAEDDETKEHTHLYLEPNRRLDTEDLRERFKEKDLSDVASDKPLGVMPFNNSTSFQDVYLYFLHDRRYLAGMKQERKYHYYERDLHTNDIEYMRELFRRSPVPKSMKNIELIDDYLNGNTMVEMLLKNNVPINQWGSVVNAFRLVNEELTASRKFRTNPIDKKTKPDKD